MSKNTIELLSDDEKQALAALYEHSGFKALKRFVELERLELAKDSINQLDILNVRYLAGQAQSLKTLIKVLEAINKEANRKD